MKALLVAHKVLISSAIALAGILIVWGIAMQQPLLSIFSAGAGLAGAWYLRHLARRTPRS